jgi:hypothetical protein
MFGGIAPGGALLGIVWPLLVLETVLFGFVLTLPVPPQAAANTATSAQKIIISGSPLAALSFVFIY